MSCWVFPAKMQNILNISYIKILITNTACILNVAEKHIT